MNSSCRQCPWLCWWFLGLVMADQWGCVLLIRFNITILPFRNPLTRSAHHPHNHLKELSGIGWILWLQFAEVINLDRHHSQSGYAIEISPPFPSFFTGGLLLMIKITQSSFLTGDTAPHSPKYIYLMTASRAKISWKNTVRIDLVMQCIRVCWPA